MAKKFYEFQPNDPVVSTFKDVGTQSATVDRNGQADLESFFGTGNSTLKSTIETTVPATAMRVTTTDPEVYELRTGAADPWDGKLDTTSQASSWLSTVTYSKGDFCTYGGKAFIATTTTTGSIPTGTGDWIVANLNNQFSSDNTSNNLDNIRVGASDATTAKEWIDYGNAAAVGNHKVAKYTMSSSLTSITLPSLTGNDKVVDMVIDLTCPSDVEIPSGFSFVGTIYWRDGEAVAPVKGSRMVYSFTADDSGGYIGSGAEFKIPA